MRVINGLDELADLTGVEIGPTEWVTVTQEMVNVFSEVTGDHQWIHLDVERATRELPFGGPIVQGFLTLSLVPKFRKELVEIRGVSRFINYGVERVRFPAPVLNGTRMRGVQTFTEVTPFGTAAVRITARFVISAEGVVKPACVADTVTLAYR